LVRRIESGAVRSERRHVDRVRPRRSWSIPIIDGKALADSFSSHAVIASRPCDRNLLTDDDMNPSDLISTGA
jgi:hypothetical protein